MTKAIWVWFKENGVAIGALASVCIILSLTGFNLNVPAYYRSLTTDGRLIFILIFNTLLSILLFSIAITRKTRKQLK